MRSNARRKHRKQAGQVLLQSMVLMGLVGMMAYIAPSILTRGRSATEDSDRINFASVLASDLLEVGQYLLLYEKAFYTDARGPLDLSGNRGTAMRQLWQMGFGGASGTNLALSEICGGFDALGTNIGKFTLGGAAVFCPLYMRSPLFNGVTLEALSFEPASRASHGRLVKDGPGHYSIEIVFFDKPLTGNKTDLITQDGSAFISLMPPGSAERQRMLSQINKTLRRATLKFDFYTDSSGFLTKTSERYVQLSSKVEYATSGFGNRTAEKQKSFSLYLPTPKDFSLFIAYPTKADGVTPTENWSESVVLPDDNKVHVYGRVFFNGKIDVPLEKLPTFHEVVILTQDFVPPLSFADKQKIRQRFLKGVITNFSAPRLVMSGDCGSGQSVINMGGLPCKNSLNGPMTIDKYLEIPASKCVNAYLTATRDSVSHNCSDPRSASVSNCPLNCSDERIVSGPYREARLMGEFAKIFAPIGKLTVGSARVYGTVLGGHISVLQKNMEFRDLASVRLGDPGVADSTQLQTFNEDAQGATAGITLPLLNLPLVFEGAGGSQ